mmetsp:Transcript_70192/g.195338  ORF Transcript_70192/g.195338 Transcript_70192/m.195338 type:complete len:393 (-) Transcript_70192:234-1412(-)
MPFQVGDLVECKDYRDITWLRAKVTALDPLEAKPDGWERGCRWNQVRHPIRIRRGERAESDANTATDSPSPVGEANVVQCSICLDAVDGGSNSAALEQSAEIEDHLALRLPCPGGHVYHKRCILQWLRRNRNCPLCRASLQAQNMSEMPSYPSPNNAAYNDAIFDRLGRFHATRDNLRHLGSIDPFVFYGLLDCYCHCVAVLCTPACDGAGQMLVAACTGGLDCIGTLLSASCGCLQGVAECVFMSGQACLSAVVSGAFGGCGTCLKGLQALCTGDFHSHGSKTYSHKHTAVKGPCAISHGNMAQAHSQVSLGGVQSKTTSSLALHGGVGCKTAVSSKSAALAMGSASLHHSVVPSAIVAHGSVLPACLVCCMPMVLGCFSGLNRGAARFPG